MSESYSRLQIPSQLQLNSKTRHDDELMNRLTKNTSLNTEFTKILDDTCFSIGASKTENSDFDNIYENNYEFDKFEQESKEVYSKLHSMEKSIDEDLKEILNSAMRLNFARSDNISHHLINIIKSKDERIKDLEIEIERLQDYRIENDVLKNKLYIIQK